MTKSITRLDLIEGGTILRQGHFTSLAFSPRDADGAIVDLTGKTIDVVIVGRPGIVYETKGTFDSVEKIIEFKISKNIGHGYMWFEITVTDPNDATYRQKFPTDEYQGKLEFIRSSDDVDYVGFSGKTVTQFLAEQKAIQTQYESTVDAKVQASDAKSTTALTKSTTAEDTANDVKSQFEQVVISGDSSVEAAAARVAPDQTFVSLKARLDAKEQAIAAQFADIGSKQAISLQERGVSHLKTAAENTQIMQTAIIEAETEGRPILLPYVPAGKWIELNDGIVIETGGIHISGYGASTRFKQTVFPKPIFDVIAPNVTIEGFHATASPFVADNTTGTRGHMTKSACAGVVAYNDNIHIRNISVENMINGALFFAYDVKNNQERANIKNCSVDGLTVKDVDFGLSAKFVTDFVINDIKGSHKKMPGSNTPPHLVYIVGSEPGVNVNVRGTNLMSYDGLDDLAFKFSGIKGGSFANITARNSQGFVWIQDNEDVQFDNLTDWEDTWADRNGSAMATYSVAKNIVISNLFIKMKGPNGKCLRLSKDGDGLTIKNSKFIASYNLDDMTLSTPVDVQGSNILIDGIEVEHTGPAELDAAIHLFDAFNVTIASASTKTIAGDGFKYGVLFAKGNGLLLKDYEMLKGNYGKVSVEPLATGFKIADQRQDGELIAYENATFLSTGTPQITTNGIPWTVLGTFSHLAGGIRMIATTGTPLAFIDTKTKNVKVSANIELKGREGLAIRVVDKDNYLTIRMDDTLNSLRLFKFVGNVATVVKEVPFTFKKLKRYNLAVEIFGDFIEVYLNGIKVMDYTLSTEEVTLFGNSTLHGIRPNFVPGGVYRNIEWRNLDAFTV